MTRMLAALRLRLRRARFRATPMRAWPVLVGTEIARTAVGLRMVNAVRRRGVTKGPATIAGPVRSTPRRSHGRNVLFISHCDFSGQSAYHVYSIATELERLGWSPVIAVPRSPRGVRELGRPLFRVLSFHQVERHGARFPDGAGPDLVHAWTPREPVRNLTRTVTHAFGCPYVVHLEDNEAAVQAAVIDAHDPAAIASFLEESAGLSVIVDRLLELKPDHVPAAVVWPGYDAAIDASGRTREDVREDIGLESGLAIVYPGNVHEVNVDEVSDLYEAVRILREGGRDVVLVKSGWNRVKSGCLPALGAGIRDLGWIGRRRVPELLRAADILVQPGAPGAFNDYRFPSKLPEFLASAHPVVLPRSNVGLHLEDGVEAMLLEHGGADEISEKVAALAEDRDLRARLGERGRAFALRELQWSTNVKQVVQLYENIAT